MHPLHSRSLLHNVPSSSDQTLAQLTKSLEVVRPNLCREIGTAIGRGSLHIANTISVRDGKLISREISYPSYHVARRHLDSRSHSNCTLYHLDILLLQHESVTNQGIEWVFIDCHAALYEAILIKIIVFTTNRTLYLFDDMQTVLLKTPRLQETLYAHGFHTLRLPSEGEDRILAASKDKAILNDLRDQKA